jgi:hypothetical protein
MRFVRDIREGLLALVTGAVYLVALIPWALLLLLVVLLGELGVALAVVGLLLGQARGVPSKPVLPVSGPVVQPMPREYRTRLTKK